MKDSTAAGVVYVIDLGSMTRGHAAGIRVWPGPKVRASHRAGICSGPHSSVAGGEMSVLWKTRFFSAWDRNQRSWWDQLSAGKGQTLHLQLLFQAVFIYVTLTGAVLMLEK